jgi:hypothetical protein
MAAARKTKISSKAASASRAPLQRPSSRTRSSAWWVVADIELCIFCHQRYAYGTGYRCVGCDIAVCGFCVQYRGQETWCPEC